MHNIYQYIIYYQHLILFIFTINFFYKSGSEYQISWDLASCHTSWIGGGGGGGGRWAKEQGRIHGRISRVWLGRSSDAKTARKTPKKQLTDRPTNIVTYRTACTQLKRGRGRWERSVAKRTRIADDHLNFELQSLSKFHLLFPLNHRNNFCLEIAVIAFL